MRHAILRSFVPVGTASLDERQRDGSMPCDPQRSSGGPRRGRGGAGMDACRHAGPCRGSSTLPQFIRTRIVAITLNGCPGYSCRLPSDEVQYSRSVRFVMLRLY